MERGELVTIIYDLHHSQAAPNLPGLAEFQRVLSPYLTQGKGRIEASDSLKTLIITDTKENLPVLEKMFKLVHHAEPPILIEAKVVEVRWSKDLQIGLEGDAAANSALLLKDTNSAVFLKEMRVKLNPQEAILPTPFQGSTLRFNRDRGSGTVGGLLQMFQQRKRAQILSQPRILVKADEKATIFAGEEIPYPAEILVHPGGTNTTLRYRNSGVSLEVTAHLAAPGQLMLRMKPEVTTVIGFVQITSTTQAPQFSVRRVETELLVRDGEEVVIGGLYRNGKNVTRRGIPFLMDIPILGYLFGKYEEEEVIQEVLFFIKPKIVKDERDLPRKLLDPDEK